MFKTVVIRTMRFFVVIICSFASFPFLTANRHRLAWNARRSEIQFFPLENLRIIHFSDLTTRVTDHDGDWH